MIIARLRKLPGILLVATSLFYTPYSFNQPLLLVINNTQWKLEIKYEFTEKGLAQSIAKTVSPQGKAELPDPQKLTSIKLKTYGKLAGLFSIPREVIKKAQESLETALAQSPTFTTVILTISPSEGPLSPIKPFRYSIQVTSKTKKVSEKVPQERHLIDAFPGVKAILQRGIDVLPRHVLEVPVDASAVSIEHAYKTLVSRWQEALKKARTPSDIRFMHDALALLEKAYNALTKKSAKSEQEFKDFAFKNIYTSTYYQEQ